MESTFDRVNRIWLLYFCTVLLLNLLFINKPVHLDDPVLLNVADRILDSPLKPLAGLFNWQGQSVPFFQLTTNPPLLGYYLAPVIQWFGHAEIPLHFVMLIFPMISAWAVLELSHRFANGSWWPPFFYMCSPALVVSLNLMRDVPMAAFFLCSVTLFVKGIDRDRIDLLVGGALLAGLGTLIKYSGAMVFPLLAMYAWLHRRPEKLWTLVVGCLPVALWVLQNWITSGGSHMVHLLNKTSVPPLKYGLAGGIVIIGSNCFLAPLLIFYLIVKKQIYYLFIAMIIFAVPAMVLAMKSLFLGRPALGVQYLFWMEMGGLLLFGAVIATWNACRAIRSAEPDQEVTDPSMAQDGIFLWIWIVLTFLFSLKMVPFQAVRHHLTLLAPVCLLAFRFARKPSLTLPSTRFPRVGLLGLLALQVGATVWVGLADRHHARIYQHFATHMRESLPSGHGTIWYVGHWGWQHYASRNGMRQLDANGLPPAANDLLVIPKVAKLYPLPFNLEKYITPVAEIPYHSPWHLFTINRELESGFYSMSGISVPYVFSKEEVMEKFTVYRVSSQQVELSR